MKHTPGPWRIATAKPGNDPDFGIKADGYEGVIAECFSEARKKGVLDIGQAKANAHLIAAAPDLLDVCKRAIGWDDFCAKELDGHKFSTGQRKLIQVAIDKAEGK